MSLSQYDMVASGVVTNPTRGRTLMSTVMNVDLTVDVISVERFSSSERFSAGIAETIDVDGGLETAETIDVDGAIKIAEAIDVNGAIEIVETIEVDSAIAFAETSDVDGAIDSHVPESVQPARAGDSPNTTAINGNTEASLLFRKCVGSSQYGIKRVESSHLCRLGRYRSHAVLSSVCCRDCVICKYDWILYIRESSD